MQKPQYKFLIVIIVNDNTDRVKHILIMEYVMLTTQSGKSMREVQFGILTLGRPGRIGVIETVRRRLS